MDTPTQTSPTNPAFQSSTGNTCTLEVCGPEPFITLCDWKARPSHRDECEFHKWYSKVKGDLVATRDKIELQVQKVS